MAWVDPNFRAVGRLARYGSVPANTRNDRLVAAFRALPALRFDAAQAARAGVPSPTQRSSSPRRLADAPSNGTADLQVARCVNARPSERRRNRCGQLA